MLRARRYRSLILWLAPLLVWQLLLPAGVMPGANAQGATLVLCSVHHVMMVPAENAKSKAAGVPGKSSSTVCAFAAVGAAAPTPSGLLWTAQDVRISSHLVLSIAQRVAPSGPYRTQISRAPPSLA